MERASFELAGNFSEKGGPGKYALEICTQAPGKSKIKWTTKKLQTTKYPKQRSGREKEADRRGTTENGTETDGGNGMNGGRVQKMVGW